MTAPDPMTALADATQAAATALTALERALEAATALVEQDMPARYDRLNRQALAARLAAAERTIARLTGPATDPAPDTTPAVGRAATVRREYGIQVWEGDGPWRVCVIDAEHRTPGEISGFLAYIRARESSTPAVQYRAVYRDLPVWTPLTDAALDALVLAETPGEGQ